MQLNPGDTVSKVSVHGGHSGQFCNHARDSLEEVIQAYIREGFSWVGITEHMPPSLDQYRYPDETQLSLDQLQQRFENYFNLCRGLQEKYRDQLEILVAFETETYPGSTGHVRKMIARLQPDYIVGSVHHVNGIGIDYNPEHYRAAIASAGNLEKLYCEYFDSQYRMVRELSPAVVGHFDLIRIFDDHYRETLQLPAIQERIIRNLELIKSRNLILDFNLRGFHKGREQYPSTAVLRQALAMGIAVVPGDDSHGVASVGKHYAQGVEILAGLGASLNWPRPALISYGD